ncbi:Chloroplast stem-loop binding protein of 41 kDa a, chloroplastic [Porphyridium purpureum]|uniref:Chloroplast stem-loop binding protein of 41 kDa a, chloroplastic n=1 Tax=Porphyridium purpureum TaxID=35688 RepID=A0A5J4YZJ7_PORPP|nr:Chloroplast stem-loop binding protein of 41 kDa a, chloroplastic [Porphyridium purpureum]|eukprot:POR5129..scf209_3
MAFVSVFVTGTPAHGAPGVMGCRRNAQESIVRGGTWRRGAAVARSGTVRMVAADKTALVVTNKGGGHGEIGFHLSLQLQQQGIAVTLLTDHAGKGQDALKKKLPFSQYKQLEDAGVECVFADLSAGDALLVLPKSGFGYVFDNQNVCQKEVAELAADTGAFYTYVSSGGMYKPGDVFPMTETTPSKPDNKQRQHEELVKASLRSKLRGCAFFRPQYIVGPYTNKRDYLDWFFDRITRDLPLPLPAPGTQTTTVTDARDVAAMLACVVSAEDAILAEEKTDAELGPVFNCASDRPVSLDGIAHACGAACGKTQAQVDKLIQHVDPARFKDAPSAGKFPFRATSFDVCVDKAKRVLGWKNQFSADFDALTKDYYEGYVSLGLHDTSKPVRMDFDRHVLENEMVQK